MTEAAVRAASDYTVRNLNSPYVSRKLDGEIRNLKKPGKRPEVKNSAPPKVLVAWRGVAQRGVLVMARRVVARCGPGNLGASRGTSGHVAPRRLASRRVTISSNFFLCHTSRRSCRPSALLSRERVRPMHRTRQRGFS